jgi:hypothetical protein
MPGPRRSADPWPDNMPVPAFGPRMVCTRCGLVGADARPNWRERPERESVTGTQWRYARVATGMISDELRKLAKSPAQNPGKRPGRRGQGEPSA